MSEASDLRASVTARRLLWISWIVALLLAGLWWRTGGGSIYDGQMTYIRVGSKAAPLLLVALAGWMRKTPRDRYQRWIHAAIGLAGVLAMWLLFDADMLALGLAERQIFTEPRFCGYIPAIAPGLAYVGVGWLALVLRAQAEACELLARAATIEAMSLRRRWIRVGVGMLLAFVGAELALFVGAHTFHADRMSGHMSPAILIACGPMLALLLFELCVRIGRRPAPRQEPLRPSGGSPRSPAATLLDPVALLRGHTAVLIARVIALLVLLAGLAVIRDVVLSRLGLPPENFTALIVGGVALGISLVLAVAPRPGPDPRRQPPAPGDGLPPGLRALIEQVEQLRAQLERRRAAVLWAPAALLAEQLANLSEAEKRLLRGRRADINALERALMRLYPLLDPELRMAPRRRALYAELTRFCRLARGCVGEHPYRGGEGPEGRGFGWLAGESWDPGLRVPAWWFAAALAVVAVWIAGFSQQAQLTLVVTTTVLGPLAYALVRAYARRMFTLACPPGDSPTTASSGYSPAFERELARRSIATQCARGLCTGVAIVIGLAIPLFCVEPGLAVGRWSLAHSAVYTTDLLPFELLGALGLLAIPIIRARLLERSDVARFRKLQRGATIAARAIVLSELIALRLAWTERLDPGLDLLERIAELLLAMPELGALRPQDHALLIERLSHTIKAGALDPTQRRALALELRSAEALLERRHA